MSTIKYYASVTWQYLKLAILTTCEYPVYLVGWLLSNPIQFVVGFATIKFVVSQFGSINGWTYEELAFLYGIAVISHALSMILFVQAWWTGQMVVEGEFDQYMIKPMSVLYQFLFCQFNIVGVTDLIPGLCVFIYGCVNVHFKCSFFNILQILMVVIGAALIRGGVYMVMGTITFWTKSTARFGGFSQEMFDKGTQYPLSMYPRVIQFVFTFIIPIGWVSFYPAKDMLGIKDGFEFVGNMPAMTLLIGIVTMIIAGAFFNLGLKKYESAGS